MSPPRLETLIDSESVIYSSLENKAVRHVIFSSEDDLAGYFECEDYTTNERLESKAVREVGRRALISDGLVPLGVGGERFAVGSIKNGLVYKYAYRSEDPENDLKVEQYDYDLCKKTFGKYVVGTYFDVMRLQGKKTLLAVQPWLDIIKSTEENYNTLGNLQEQEEEILAKSEKLLDDTGLVLDGGGVDIMRGNGIILPDTSLIQQSRILNLPTEVIPERGQRTWRSLSMDGSFMIEDSELVKH